MERTPVPEAQLIQTDGGLAPDGDGWFVVNVAEATAMGMDDGLYAILFEGRSARFPQFGINLRVLDPGRPAAFYHAESAQEAFLVLRGECVLIIEEQERRLRQWDFVHCPPQTAHVLVGAGEGPCIVLMVGARTGDGSKIHYPVSQLAGRHGASSAVETDDPRQAYATLGAPPRPGRFAWPPSAGTGAG